MRIFLSGLLLILCSLSLRAEEPLPPEFLDAAPKVQLYMAYAQFKMAQHATARRMWEAIQGAGEAEAAFNLGILYEQGMGVVADGPRAAAYYLKAAQSGSRAGAYQLGLMHATRPELVDRATAERWLSAAALDGDEDAAQLLQQLLQQGDLTDPLLRVRAMIAANQTESALALLREQTALLPPNYRALTLLAWLHETGLGVERDIDRAAELFRRAADGGDAEAQYALAVMLQTGVGQVRDPTEAERWLQRAADQGYQPAIGKLAEH